MSFSELPQRTPEGIRLQMDTLRSQMPGAEGSLAQAIAKQLGELQLELEALERGDNDTSLAALVRRNELTTTTVSPSLSDLFHLDDGSGALSEQPRGEQPGRRWGHVGLTLAVVLAVALVLAFVALL